MFIFFRVNLSKKSGLGHFIRSKRLAEEFSKRNINTYIVIDNKYKRIRLNKFLNIKYLYEKNESYNVRHDAKRFLDLISNEKSIIIVDDYRVDDNWIKEVKKNHHKLIIFDDFFKKFSSSDYIINTKPNFLIREYLEKYKKININSKLIMNPKYSLLSKIKKKKYKTKKFNIMLYLGASFDVSPLIKIILYIKKNYKNTDRNLNYYLVVGPFSKKNIKISQISKFSNIKILINKNDVIAKYNFIDLFVGSSGMSLYENKYYNIPSIFFQMSDNQKIDSDATDLLGFYFFLERKSIYNFKKISKLIFEVYKNYPKVKKYLINSTVKLDQNGSKRIVDTIISGKKVKLNHKNNIIVKKQKYFSNVNLSHINDYLSSRNLYKNRSQSISSKEIPKLEHFLWWFKNKRKSSVFYENGKLSLFLYYEYAHINYEKYIIPGWFFSKYSLKFNFLKLLRAITSHHSKIEKIAKSKNFKIISLINRTNSSMVKITEAMKYKKIKSKKKSKIIYDYFGIKKNNKFLIYEKTKF